MLALRVGLLVGLLADAVLHDLEVHGLLLDGARALVRLLLPGGDAALPLRERPLALREEPLLVPGGRGGHVLLPAACLLAFQDLGALLADAVAPPLEVPLALQHLVEIHLLLLPVARKQLLQARAHLHLGQQRPRPWPTRALRGASRRGPRGREDPPHRGVVDFHYLGAALRRGPARHRRHGRRSRARRTP